MKLKYVDALRGIAIILVIIVHTRQYGKSIYNNTIDFVIGQGARGVQLFFVTSALTLMLSYYNRKKKVKGAPIRNFFIRRFFRIAPMYYLGIIYFIFQNGLGPRYWLGDATEITKANILSNIFFIHGINPYWITSLVPGGWSITVEMTFYLLFPILALQVKSFRSAINFTALSLLFLLTLKFMLVDNAYISSNRLWDAYLFFFFPSQLPVFGIGFIAYFIIFKREMTLSRLNVLLLTSVFLVQFLLDQFVPGHIIISVLFLFLILFLSKYRIAILVNRVSVFIGKISYSGYLVHFAVLYWLNEMGFVDFFPIDSQSDSFINYSIRLLVVLIITILISFITFTFIEKPFMVLGRRLIDKLSIKRE